MPRAILARARPALGQGPALPAFEADRYHRADLPHLVKARRAAESGHKILFGGEHELSAILLNDLGGELVALTGAIYTVGARLGDARRFLDANDPDHIARERAELELQAIGASAHELADLKRAQASLERRVGLVGTVEDEVKRLGSRLASSAAQLEELTARLQVAISSEDVLHEVRAYHRTAELALEAFESTWSELGDVSS